MALITRVARLFKADMHAIIDTIEDPESLLRQSIREMENQVEESEVTLAGMTAEHETFMTKISDINDLLEKDEEELDLCFENSNDELAKSIIKRRLERNLYRNIFEEKIASLSKLIVKQNKELSDNRQALESTKQKAELLINSVSAVNEEYCPDVTISNDDVEVAFLREKKKRSVS